MKRSTISVLVLLPVIVGLLVWAVMQGESSPQPVPDAGMHVPTPSETSAPTVADFVNDALPTRTSAEALPIAASKKDTIPEQSTSPQLRGRVVDDAGNPVTSFDIQFRSGKSAPEQDYKANDRIMGDAPIRHFDHANGEFELRVNEGQWLVRASREAGSKSVAVDVVVPQAAGSGLVIVLPRGSRIGGIVQGTNGIPIEGAGVHARAPGGRLPSLQDENTPQPTVRTNAAGRFELVEGVAGNLFVAASHPDYAESDWIEVSSERDRSKDVVITLVPGGRIVGTVDAPQAPLGNRRVDLFSFNGSLGWRHTTTDDNGRFEIKHVVPQRYVVELRPPGYPRSQSEGKSIRKNIEARDGETTEVVLGASRGEMRLRGIVVQAGNPVAGVAVHAYSRDGGEDRADEPITDADGRFEITVDGPGPYSFSLRSPADSYVQVERTIARDTKEVRFELPGGAIRGVVLTPQGKPIQYAPVTLLRDVAIVSSDAKDFWPRYHKGRTDESGRFEFGFLEPATYTLRTPDGHLRDSPAPRIPHGGVAMAGIKVGAEVVELSEIRLKEEGHILGTLVDAAGNGIGNAAIQAANDSGVDCFAYAQIRTDTAGSFTIDSLAPGTYTVRARKGESRMTSAPVLVEVNKTATVRIQLP